MFVRYRFSRQPLNRLFWNLARVFDMMSERQLSILVSNGCIINDLSHKLCVGRSVTSDRYKKPKLRRHNALVSLHFNPTSNIWRQKHWTNWRAAGGEQQVIKSIASTVFNGWAQLVITKFCKSCKITYYPGFFGHYGEKCRWYFVYIQEVSAKVSCTYMR